MVDAVISLHREEDYVRENVVRAMEINKLIRSDEFDHESVKIKLQSIYDDLIKIIQGEISNKPIVDRRLTPLMIELAKFIENPLVQTDLILLTSALKTQRITTELVWIHQWKVPLCIYKESRDKLIDLATRIQSLLASNKNRTMVVEADYEAACFEQAAKLLIPTHGEWFTNFNPEILGRDDKYDMNEFFSKFKSNVSLAVNEGLEGWYINIIPLEWQSRSNTTLELFESSIQPQVDKLLENVDKCGVGIINIYSNIYNYTNENEVKKRVISKIKEISLKIPCSDELKRFASNCLSLLYTSKFKNW
jgi:hypothetical protein